jgi:hypothetical protein
MEARNLPIKALVGEKLTVIKPALREVMDDSPLFNSTRDPAQHNLVILTCLHESHSVRD